MSTYYESAYAVWSPAAPVAREAVAVECGGAERRLPEGVVWMPTPVGPGGAVAFVPSETAKPMDTGTDATRTGAIAASIAQTPQMPEIPREAVTVAAEAVSRVDGAVAKTGALFDVPAIPARPKRNTRKPVNQAPKHSDHFQTPGEALLPLLPYLPSDATIWEPACGKRNLVRFLQGRDYDCFGTDLLEGHDFLTMPAPRDFDVIATNPPYSSKDLILSRCYEIGKPFALLLPYTALEGQLRQSLYRKHGVEVLVMSRRVNFETPNDRGSSAWFPTAWICWKLLPSPLIFAPLEENP